MNVLKGNAIQVLFFCLRLYNSTAIFKRLSGLKSLYLPLQDPCSGTPHIPPEHEWAIATFLGNAPFPSHTAQST